MLFEIFVLSLMNQTNKKYIKMTKAIIKTEKEINDSCTSKTKEGFHFRGQFFPNELLNLCGLEVEGELWASKLVLECKINNEWHFFSVDSLKIQAD